MRAATEILNIRHVRGASAGLLSVGPSLLVGVLTSLLVERNDALACLRDVCPGAEVLQISGICRHGPGLLGISPGFFLRIFGRLIIGCLLLCRRRFRIRGLAASRKKRSASNDGNGRRAAERGPEFSSSEVACHVTLQLEVIHAVEDDTTFPP